jgi:PAS domain S-box-containing protein
MTMTSNFSLLESIASDWWWEMDADLRFVFVSDRFSEVFGWPVSVIVGKRRTDLDRSDYDNLAWANHLDDLAHRRPFRNFETTFVDVNGASRPVKISGMPLFAADGAFQGYVGVGHDLTELHERQRRAVALSENLTSIIENIDQGVALFDKDLKLVIHNNRLAALLQLVPGEFPTGSSFEDIVVDIAGRGEYGPEEVQSAVATRLTLAQSRRRQVLERKRSDGRIVSVTSTPIAGGGLVLTYSDVTALREREARLAEGEELYRHLFFNSPLPKWVYNARTLEFLEVNDAAVEKYGYSREEFLSMSLRDIRPPDEVARLERFLTLPLEERYHAKEWKHRRKDGQLLDVDVFLRDLTFEGIPARLAVIIDNTAQREAQRYTDRVFETSHDVILVTDSHGRLVRVSPSVERTLGYRPDEMIGRRGRDFILSEDLATTRMHIRAVRRGKDVSNFRCRYLHKDGRVVSLSWNAVWSDADRRYFFMGRDMTEYDRTQDELRQAQKMEAVGQLTGGVAHDFNNILMVILAKIEALEEDYAVDQRLLEEINVITAAAERAADLTRQLLAFSRKQPLHPQHTSINDLVVATGKLLRRTLGEQIELEAVLSDDLWVVEVDRAQLEAALVNLCINARDAMPNGGHLLIETQNTALDDDYVAQHPDVSAGEYVLLAVTDDGVGIAPELLDRVFEPFFTTKAVGKGSGLGLSMVYGFIKQSKGHIKIYSEFGRGTTIKIYLPRSLAVKENLIKPDSSRPPRGNERVLVVEDDTQVRASVVRQLQGLGYSITEADNGEAALVAFADAPVPFDLILTDVVMPGKLSGKALADEISRRWPGTKVLFMSGYTENAIVHHGRIDPGVRLLSKPFRKIDLARALREVLEAGKP